MTCIVFVEFINVFETVFGIELAYLLKKKNAMHLESQKYLIIM